jgi:hypothetical protein
MKRLMCATYLTALVLFLVPGSASPGPKADHFLNFSGTWKMDTERSESAHSGEPIVATTLIIKQTPSALNIETHLGSETETLTYNLDGSTTKQSPEIEGAVSWRAHWDGAKLVTETARNIHGAAVVITEVRSLDETGKQMTIERTLAVQHGYDTIGQSSSSAKDVFIKVS